jgi:hypothetical protein
MSKHSVLVVIAAICLAAGAGQSGGIAWENA